MRRIVPVLLLALLEGLSAAQTKPEPAAGLSRLREFEATYQAGLRKIQEPLLQGYALKLQQLMTTVPETDHPVIQAELARVQSIIASGGIVDLRSATATTQSELPPRPGPRPGGMKGPPGAVLVLKPDTAKGPAVLGGTLTIGKAAWTVEHLDAGTYEVTLLCSFAPFSGTAFITATLDGQEARKELSPDNASGMPGQFPVLRLGRMQFERDVEKKDLQIELTATELTGVQVRQVVFSRPRPGAK